MNHDRTISYDDNTLSVRETRIEYVDIAKGIGIILVIFGHVVWGGNYMMPRASDFSNFIYSFHMPLFFIISGLCIKESKQFNSVTVKKMARTYLLPYVIWTLLYLCIQDVKAVLGVREFNNGLFAQAISVCGIAPLWFLLALFLSEALCLVLKPLMKNCKRYWTILILLALASIWVSIWYDSLVDINLIARNYIIGLLRILPTTFFVILGYGNKEIMKKCNEWPLWQKIVGTLLFLCLELVLCIKWNQPIDIHVFKLADQWLYFIKAIVGSMMILILSQAIHSKTLITIGKKTKEIMILHYPPFAWTSVLRFVLGKIFEPNFVGALIITVVTLVGCLTIDYIFNRFKVWKFIMGR